MIYIRAALIKKDIAKRHRETTYGSRFWGGKNGTRRWDPLVRSSGTLAGPSGPHGGTKLLKYVLHFYLWALSDEYLRSWPVRLCIPWASQQYSRTDHCSKNKTFYFSGSNFFLTKIILGGEDTNNNCERKIGNNSNERQQ